MSSALTRLHAGGGSVGVQIEVPRPLDGLVDQALVRDDELVAIVVWLGAVVPVTALVALLFGSVPAVVAAFTMLATPVAVLLARRGRRERTMLGELPEFLDQLARSLRSGASFHQAFTEVVHHGPAVVGDDLRVVLADIAQRRALGDAIGEWAQRQASDEARLVGASLALAAQNASGAARALEGMGQSLRDRATLRSEVAALTSQAVASMAVLVALPPMMLGVGLSVNRAAVGFLFSEPLGQTCLVAGVALDVLGWWWMRRLVTRRLK